MRTGRVITTGELRRIPGCEPLTRLPQQPDTQCCGRMDTGHRKNVAVTGTITHQWNLELRCRKLPYTRQTITGASAKSERRGHRRSAPENHTPDGFVNGLSSRFGEYLNRTLHYRVNRGRLDEVAQCRVLAKLEELG